MANRFYNVYQSPAEFVAAAKSVRRSDFVKYETSMEHFDSFNGSNDFYGNWEATIKTFDECTFKTQAALTDTILDDLRTVDFSEIKWKFMQQLEEGDSVDIERYLSGLERCWTGVKRLPRSRQSVRIYVNFGGNCGRSAYELSVAGALAATAAELLESTGIAAEIWGCNLVHDMDRAGNDYLTLIRLKKQNEYADLGMINFVIGNVGMFRNVLWRTWLKNAAKHGCDTTGYLGRTVYCSFDDIGLLDAERKSAILIPPIYELDKAKDWLSNKFPTLINS